MYHTPPIKVVFAIRYDWVSYLDRLAPYIHDIKNKWYELKPLNKEQAQEVIKKPAALENLPNIQFNSEKFSFTQAAIQKIIAAAQDTSNHNEIDTAQLQILCYFAAEKKVIQEEINQITEAHLGNTEDIFTAYYQKILEKIRKLSDVSEKISKNALGRQARHGKQTSFCG